MQSIVALIAVVLAIGVVVFGGYQASLVLEASMPGGVLPALLLLLVSVFCMIACAAIGCLAGAWVEDSARYRAPAAPRAGRRVPG
jgi:hypothetical protein